MGKKRFLVGILILLMIAVTAMSLVACKDVTTEIDIDKDKSNTYIPPASDLLLKTLKAMGSSEDFVGMNFDSTIKVSNGEGGYDERRVYIKGNFYTEEENEYVELGLGVLDTEGNGVEIFLKDGRLYLKVGDVSLYIEDFDFRWLIEQIGKLQSIDNVLSKVLGLIPGIDLGAMTFESLLNLVATLTFQVDSYSIVGNKENISLQFVPDQVISMLIGVLSEIDIDAALAGAGIDLGFSLNEFIANFQFPNVKILVQTTLVDGKPDEKGVVLNIKDSIDEDIFHMATTSMFTEEKIDFIPENIAEFVPFGLLKLQFDTTIDLQGKDVDVANIVNTFAGKEMLPEGDLILNADLGLYAKFKVDIKLRPNYDEPIESDGGLATFSDDSMLLFEIYSKRNTTTPLLGAYLKDNNIYVNIDNIINMKDGNIHFAPKNIVIPGLYLSSFLSSWFDAAKDCLAGIIDQVFPPEEEEGEIAPDDVVFAMSTNADGTQYISPVIGTIIDIAKNAVGLGEFINYDDNSIDVTLNNKLLAALEEKFAFGLPAIPDFGEVVLSVEFAEKGLDNISLTADLNDQFGLFGKIKLDNFTYGFPYANMAEDIEKAIEGKEYVSNVKDLIYSALDDVDVAFNAKFTLEKGQYNLSNLINTILTIAKVEMPEGFVLPNLPIELSNDLVLDLELGLQVQMDTILATIEENGVQKQVEQKIISRAKISITNNQSNLIFPDTGEVITAYYFDDRYSGNDSLDLQRAEIVGNKKSHGTLYLDLRGFKLANVQLPNFALDIDLTSLIISAIDTIDFEFAIPSLPEGNIPIPDLGFGGGTEEPAEPDEEEALQAAIMRSLYSGEINTTMLHLACTSQIINAVLAVAGLQFEVPEIELDLLVDTVEGIVLTINGYDDYNSYKEISLELSIPRAKFGKQIDINVDNFDSSTYGDGLTEGIEDIIYSALDDVNAEINLELKMDAGTYNLAYLLKMLGLEVDDIQVKFDEDFILDLALILQLQLDEVPLVDKNNRPIFMKDGVVVPEGTVGAVAQTEKVISRAFVALRNKSPNFIFKNVEDVISAYYLDDRFEDNKKYLSKLPGYEYKYNPETDVVEKSHGTIFLNLNNLNIANINISNTTLDLDLTSIIKDVIGGLNLGGEAETQVVEAAFASAVSQTMMVADAPADDSNYMQIVITSAIVNQLLAQFGVAIELPELEVGIKIDQIEGLVISLVGFDNYQDDYKEITGSLSLPTFALGRDCVIDFNEFEPLQYKTKFKDIIKELLRYGQIEGRIDLSSNSTSLDLRSLINSILALSGQKFTMPVNIDLNDFSNTFEMLVQWQFDYENPERTKANIQINCDGAPLIGLYINNANFYLDLSGLALPKLALTDTKMVYKLVSMIDGALDSILAGIIPETNSEMAIQQRLADANGESVAEMNNRIFAEAAASDSNDIMSYINLLLKGVMIDNGKVVVNLTNEIIAELFGKFALNINQEASVNGELDIVGGGLKLGVKFDEIELDASINIKNIGKPMSFTIPTDYRSYVNLNGATGADMVTSIFDALKPGIWMDLITYNCTIQAWNSDGTNPYKLTKLLMQRVPDGGIELANTGGDRAPGGSLLIALSRQDQRAGIPVYIIINPYATTNNVRIRGTKNLLPDLAGIDLAHFINIPITVDIKTMLLDLFGPLLADINSDTEIGGAADEASILDGLTIDSIINGINVKVYDCKNVKLNVNLNHNTVNNLVPKLINMLNGMSLDLGSGPVTISGVVYDNKNAHVTFNSIWTRVVVPLIKSVAAGIDIDNVFLRPIVSNIKGSIEDLVGRILPLPQFVELNANVYVVNGKLDNFHLIGYGAGSTTDTNRHRFELRAFNDIANSNTFFAEMNYLDLNNVKYQAPYIYYDVDSQSNLADEFVTKSYRHNKESIYYDTSAVKVSGGVSWEVISFNGEEYATPVKFSKDNMNAFKLGANGAYKPGTYIARASSDLGGIMDVTVVIENNSQKYSQATAVKDIVVQAGEKLPSRITLLNGDVEFKTNLFEYQNAGPKEIGEHTITASVRLTAKNINGKVLPVKITYKDNALVLDDPDTPYKVSVHNYKSFYDNVYKKGEILVKTKEGRTVNVACDFSIKAGNAPLFNDDGTLANETMWVKGFTTYVQIKLKDAIAGQDVLEKKVIVESSEIDFARFDSKNTILINTYENISHMPTSVQLYFKDGSFKNFRITSWDVQDGTFGVAGSHKNAATFTIQSEYDGTNIGLSYSVDVIVQSVEVAYACIGAENDVKECFISYEEYESLQSGNYFDKNLRLVTTDGKVVEYQDEYTYDTGRTETDSEGNQVPIYALQINYKYDFAGIVLNPETGGTIRAKVTLYNGDKDDKSKHVTVYIYFSVAPRATV